MAFAVVEHLDGIGHAGPRVLIHSDLGVTEWRDSLLWCQKLADRLKLELVAVRRQKGDMMDRWEQRWEDNLKRYCELSCVKLILPWSTPSMRFCTSELKVAVICQDLVKRWPGQTIVNANGIRREESPGRACKPVWQPQKKLTRKTLKTDGVDWHPIIDWTLEDVYGFLRSRSFPLHPAYVLYELTRVSCVFCIMSSLGDLRNAVRCEANHAIYRRMVDLEIRSTFAFHEKCWLGDIAPDLLSQERQWDLEFAKQDAATRVTIESRIPDDLLYVKGWPTRVPNRQEAELLADVRARIRDLIKAPVGYTCWTAVMNRYQELLDAKNN